MVEELEVYSLGVAQGVVCTLHSQVSRRGVGRCVCAAPSHGRPRCLHTLLHSLARCLHISMAACGVLWPTFHYLAGDQLPDPHSVCIYSSSKGLVGFKPSDLIEKKIMTRDWLPFKPY